MTTKTYHGQRIAGAARIWTTQVTDGTVIQRELKHHELHSPTGMEWGYGGSGPADLALAILIDHLGETPSRADLYGGRSLAGRLHQRFKWDFVAQFGPEWELSSGQIELWLREPEIAAMADAFRRTWAEVEEIERTGRLAEEDKA